MTRDVLARWIIALLVGLGIAPLAPESAPDHPFFVAAADCASGAVAPDADLIPAQTVASAAYAPDQRRGVLHHYVVPGKVSEDAADAAGPTPD